MWWSKTKWNHIIWMHKIKREHKNTSREHRLKRIVKPVFGWTSIFDDIINVWNILYTHIYFECVLILGLWYCRTVISFWTLNYIRTNLKIKLSTSVGLQARARASALSQFMQVSPVLFAVWYETHKLDVNTGYGAVLFSFLLFLFSQNDSHFIGNSFFFLLCFCFATCSHL